MRRAYETEREARHTNMPAQRANFLNKQLGVLNFFRVSHNSAKKHNFSIMDKLKNANDDDNDYDRQN